MISSLKKIGKVGERRNKLLHGQITGEDLGADNLRNDVRELVDWVGRLGTTADSQLGYDGLRRNTYEQAKTKKNTSEPTSLFNDPDSFKAWLAQAIQDQKNGSR